MILAHCYQPVEIDLVADYVGDSLYLSQVAAKTDADDYSFLQVFILWLKLQSCYRRIKSIITANGRRLQNG